MIESMEQQLIQALQEEKQKTRGFLDTLRGFTSALYGMTIAKWTNPLLHQITWELIRISKQSTIYPSGEENPGCLEDPTVSKVSSKVIGGDCEEDYVEDAPYPGHPDFGKKQQ